MNKRGQFYLVAGIIIITVIVSLIAMMNYVQKNPTIIVNDLKEELKIETQKVLDYDISNGQNRIEQYGKDYSNHLGSGIELYFIKGVDPDINAYRYVNGFETPMDDPEIVDGKIIFTLNETDYEFDLMPSENFYYLISQEIKGELFVATG